MSKRQIIIKAKQTSASTTYYDMTPDDKQFIFNTVIRYMGEFMEQAHWRTDFREAIFAPQKQLQKRFNSDTNRYEPNSYASMMGGLVANYRKHNGKNDISKPQINSIQILFELFCNFDGLVQEIEFVDWETAAIESENNRDKFFNDLFDK